MIRWIRRFAGTLAAATFAVSLTCPAWAQESGVRRLVVPFSAGASPDVMGRMVGEEMARRLKESVIVENRPGAGGNLAAEYVLKQPADGRTVFLGSTANLAVNKSLYKKLPYDPETDFIPLTIAWTTRNLLVVPATSNLRSVADVVAAARARPSSLSYGSPGNGTAGHLVGAMFEQSTGVSLMHVPYKGQNQVVNDLLGGHIAMSFETIGSAMPMLQSGKLIALATTGDKRHAQLPNVPTFKEAGVDHVDALRGWAMFAVARGTPAKEVDRLHTVISESLVAARKRIEDLGVEVAPISVEASQRMVSEEVRRWGQLVKATGATAD
jgi:tripartite-type tricarboxylate transporter receptor subunit TctC